MSSDIDTMRAENDSKRALAPTLRFPEFRDAAGWKAMPLGNLFSDRQETGQSDLPLLSLMDKEGIVPQENTNRKNNSNSDKSKYRRVVPGDIAYNTMRMWEGRSAYVGLEGLVSPAYTVCQPKAGTHSLFFSHYFKTPQLIEQFRRYSQGLVKDTLNLKYEAFSKISVLTPPTSEQEKIADCLSSVDELIAVQTRKVDALKTHKKGLMQQLFPGEGETQPRLRFPEFQHAGEWEQGQIADIGTVLQGYGFPEKHQGSRSGDYPFYKVSDISRSVDTGKVFIEASVNYISASLLNELRAKPIPPGTVVFAKIGEAIRSNKRAITTAPCLIDNNAAGIKAVAGKATDFFVYLVMEQVPLIEHAGGVVPAVNKTAIEGIAAKYPRINEQQRIAECFASLNDLIASQTERLDALRTHKKGLMQQLFPSTEET